MLLLMMKMIGTNAAAADDLKMMIGTNAAANDDN